jgi:hypothetical protein
MKFFMSNTGRSTQRWLDYFPIYERHFAPFRDKRPAVLEIGVKKGGSLHMWRHYFGAGATIIGVDKNEACVGLRKDGFIVEIGDQASPAFWQEFKALHPKIDILIDDGGHRMEQQITTFQCMFPHISENGIYLCEDLHTSYWPKFGGGAGRNDTFIALTKTLIDELNQWQILGIGAPPTEFTKSCASMHFYAGMVIFEKAKRSIPRAATSAKGVVKILPPGEA